MALNRDQILQADDLRRVEAEVPEWGGSVWVSTMGGDARGEFESIFARREAGEITELDVLASLLAFTLTDADGARLFTLEETDGLKRKSAAVLARLGLVAANVNALSADDIKDLEGNSEPGQS